MTTALIVAVVLLAWGLALRALYEVFWPRWRRWWAERAAESSTRAAQETLDQEAWAAIQRAKAAREQAVGVLSRELAQETSVPPKVDWVRIEGAVLAEGHGHSLGPVGAVHPHCDPLVLHAPGECQYCDLYPQRQSARIANRVNFTGWEDPLCEPCPSTRVRPLEMINRWPGNRAKP